MTPVPVCRLSPVILLLAFLLAALALTYPLILRPFSHIPLGDERVGTVPYFNLWTLQWNIDQLMQGYPNYWDAPIFAGTAGAFAFSEAQPLSALLAAPLWLGLQSPAFGYNAVVILFLTLNGWFAFWLLKSWGVTTGPAFLAGLLAQALPFAAQEMGVLQLIALFGLLWSLLFLSRLLAQSRQGWRNVVGLALGAPVTFFTCGYYGLFSLLFLPLFLLIKFPYRHPKPALAPLLLALALTAALTTPFLWAQQQRLARHGFTRNETTIENNSARVTYYANFLDHNLFYGQLLGFESGAGQRLFPGLGLVLLAGLGLGGGLNRRAKLYLILAVAVALLLSLGLRLRLGDFQPYQLVRLYVPGFLQLRSPFRFAAPAQLHLALLAGFGLFNLTRWLPPGGRWVAVGAAGLVALELLALPLPLQPVPNLPANAPWQRWLNSQPEPPVIVLLPFAASSRVADFEQTTRWMLQSRYFAAKMVNGYSGFFPAYHTRLREQLLNFPSAEGVGFLRELGVEYVVVHHYLPNAPPAKTVSHYLRQVFEDTRRRVSIYAVD